MAVNGHPLAIGCHMNALCDLGATELSRLMADREISPVELLDACLSRIATVNPAVNAVDPALSAAGSSGGSAVALACGMAPLASGSDTGGSLRNPAAYAGVVGFRPSYGLVPSERRLFGWSGLSTDGPMARTVADTALRLSVLASDDARDPLAYTLPNEPARGRRA